MTKLEQKMLQLLILNQAVLEDFIKNVGVAAVDDYTALNLAVTRNTAIIAEHKQDILTVN